MYRLKVLNKSIILFVVALFLFYISNTNASTPLNIKVTNIRGTQFTVSWMSKIEEIGSIKYGLNIDNYENWSVAYDERGDNISDDIHHITLKGLSHNTTYYYVIISGDTIDDNNTAYYHINSGPVLDPVGGSCMPAGKVYKDEAKTQFAFDSIVYIKILGDTELENSATESVLVTSDTNGYWFIELINFRNQDYQSYYKYECGNSDLMIEVEGGNDGSGKITTKAIDYTIEECSVIVLKKNNELPKANISGTPLSPTNLTSVTLNISGDQIETYKYKLDDGIYSNEIKIENPIYLDSLSNGVHTIYVIGKNSDGEWQEEINATFVNWKIDTIPPVAIISGSPPVMTNDNYAILNISGEDVVVYKYKFDDNNYSDERIVETQISLAGIPDGNHTLYVIGRDSVGNWQEESNASSSSWTVNTSNPAVIISGVPASPTNSTNLFLNISGNDVIAYKHKLDDGAYSTEKSVDEPISYNDIADGIHIVYVIGKDSAGNWQKESNATSKSWTVDTIPPVVEVSEPPLSQTNLTEATFDITGNDVVAYKYKLDDGNYSVETSINDQIKLESISKGIHTIYVIGKDNAGNWQEDANATYKRWEVIFSAVEVIPPVVEEEEWWEKICFINTCYF